MRTHPSPHPGLPGRAPCTAAALQGMLRERGGLMYPEVYFDKGLRRRQWRLIARRWTVRMWAAATCSWALLFYAALVLAWGVERIGR